MPQRNLFSWNTIISAQVKSHNLVQARAMFDSAPLRDSVTYNSLLSGYVRAGGEFERLAFELFVDMWSHRPDEMRIDEVTLTIMVNLCAKSAMLCFATQLHGHMVKTGNDLSGFAVSSLIGMYSKCGCFREACSAFETCEAADADSVTKNSLLAACCRAGEMDMAASVFEMATELNDTISWNTLIWGYVQNGCVDEIFDLFLRMRENGVEHDVHTFASLLIACSRLKSLNRGKEVHAYVVKNGFLTNPFIHDGIVDVYCKCGNMKYAELLHYSTTASPFSVTSMVAGYSSRGNMEEARKLFDSLVEKNAIAWTSLFSGYVKTQQCEAVFDLLSQFRAKEEGKMSKSPNCLILVSVLGACALQASLLSGKQVHGFALRSTIEMDEKMISATVDMYIKCGCLSYAEKIFKRVLEKDIVLYNVMLAGCGHHGDADKAIGLFRDMTKKGIPPDEITFVAILSACRHCGLVELGERFFDSMEVVYGVVPESDHYACMIDLYGRANRLEDAKTFFMERIPEEERKCGVIVGAFLNACKNGELARKVEATMLGGGGGRYVQLANVYAAEGKWIEMQRVRKMMRGKERKKFAGCSWVYVDDRPQIFTSGDATHPRSSCVYEILHSLTAELGRKL
ncbi:Putative pentatricopeptide repeat-containing protein At3g18840 [Linum grandiflorum]